MPLDLFHPAVAAWFRGAFPAPTAAQAAAWPAIASGRHTLIAAPTGSGKTLTAFMTAIDALVREGLAHGLRDETAVVYVSPLKALSNDIHINLDAPLAGIRAELERMGLPDVEIRTAVRTGDTPQSERAALRRKPPHILVTTPESLYVLLGSGSGRAMLATVRTVIVDEIHAVAASKRGSHLALSLERLEALCGHALTRIGVSATQKPIGEIAKFLVGTGNLVRRDAGAVDLPLPQAGEGELVPGGTGSEDIAAIDELVADCEIVDIGYTKQRDLALELPPTPLSVIMSNDQWAQVYARVAELANAHRTTLVFVNTRRMAERAARHLGELLGKETVAAHHGSLAKELRLDAEQRLKRGDLRLLVATSSLELGIDIGDVDLVCQLGSPRAIAAFLQRAGRSGHAVGGVPKARLFPQSRDELVECAALLDCVRRGELDALKIPPAPLDVLAQQIVAEVACREWDEDALYDWLRRAWPYARLPRETYDAVLRMLAEGYATRRGARAGLLHRDAVNRRLRGRQGARMTAVMSGGTIPDTADYAVIMEPQAINIGSVHEDFAVESLAGDVFQLGNASYRILRIEPGRLRVEDAQGAPPNIPFWIGEAPGRTDELSIGVSRLREEVVSRLRFASASDVDADADMRSKSTPSQPVRPAGIAVGRSSVHEPMARERTSSPPSHSAKGREQKHVLYSADEEQERLPPPLSRSEGGGREGVLFAEGITDAHTWLTTEVGLDATAAHQLVDYIARTQAALGTLPTQHRIVLERFFDESGGTQLVIHTPFGSRVNRAWGLSLRKRFCRKFNFELQAAATEDAIVLSLSTSHSFPLIEVAQYLHSSSALDVLVQALLDAPLFGVRWRWNATTALALPRFVGGRKVAPQLQRMKSEDLLATVFPDQVACLENIVGERQVPDHPLVAQTLHDCLYEAMDAEGWLRVLRGMEGGAIEVVARDLAAPSPLAMEALHARPYAFLDDAPLEERRTQAVQSRRYSDAEDAGDLGRLDPDAIAAVHEEAWPQPRIADEMHEALTSLGFVTAAEADANPQWSTWLQRLVKDQRATLLNPSSTALLSPSPTGRGVGERGERSDGVADAPHHQALWTCAERLPQLQTLFPNATLHPRIEPPSDYARESWTREAALVELLRARLGGLGPVTAAALAAALPVDTTEIEIALLQLQSEGVAMQGHFSTGLSAQHDAPVEWCERHLLARIHRYTLRRLRREIEPVEPRDFMRFLCDWQHVSRDTRVSGPDALAGVIAQLEGFEAPAGTWETELLPARVTDYAITWLDDLCTAGRVLWTRLRARAESVAARGAPSLRATPIVLLPRRHAALWARLATNDGDASPVSSRAQRVLDALARNGASFFDELVDDAHLLRIELEEALAELVARGRIHCDSFAGLRALLVPASKRPSARSHGRRRVALFGIEDAGRWALIPGRPPSVQHDRSHDEGQDTSSRHPRESGDPVTLVSTSSGDGPTKATAKSLGSRFRGNDEQKQKPTKPDPEAIEHVARVLLRRYGVICWRLLEREAAWLPPWRELLRVYHRLEARGELRGGRFIAGLSGEQFALPDAVATLRRVRQRAHDGEIVCVSASDPLNLAGTVLAGDKVPRLPGARVAYRDGVAVAALVAGDVTVLAHLQHGERAVVRQRLLHEPMHRGMGEAAAAPSVH